MGPGDPFRSDLTSVPSLFTWLVPRTGRHLPAALVHDGLIASRGEPAAYSTSTDVAVPRVDADRIFREAMGDLGTGFFRRWLMWSAVSLATVMAGVTDVAPPNGVTTSTDVRESRSRRDKLTNWYYRLAVFGSLLAIVVIGSLASSTCGT